MGKFKVIKEQNCSVNRSIRIDKRTLEKLELISSVSGISVNKIINQCIEFSLENMANK